MTNVDNLGLGTPGGLARQAGKPTLIGDTDLTWSVKGDLVLSRLLRQRKHRASTEFCLNTVHRRLRITSS
jgi:hypothetical protein